MNSISKYILILAVFFLWQTCFSLHAQVIGYQSHISNPNIQAYTQDHEGFLWIGTIHGLNRFDGYNYIPFYTSEGENGLPNDNILGLLTDSQGNVWISHECGLTVWEKEHERLRNPEFSTFNLYSNLQELDKDYLLATNRGKIVGINKASMHEDYQFSLPRCFNPAIVSLPQQKQVWAAGDTPENNHTITILSQKLQPLQNFQVPVAVKSMQTDVDGNVWIISPQGLTFINSTTHAPMENPLTRFCQGGSKYILFLHTNQPGEITVGIQNEGMYRYDTKTQKLSLISVRQSLNGTHWESFLDREGTLWLSDRRHEMGCYPKNDSYKTLHMGKRGLADYYLLTIAADKEGNLWIRSAQDLIGMNPETEEIFYHENGCFGEFTLTADQHLWYITGNRNRVVKAYIRLHTLEKQQAWDTDDILLSVCQNAEGQIWVATGKKLGLLKADGTIHWVNVPQGTNLRGLYEVHPSGELIATTNTGVFRFEHEKFLPFDIPVKSPSFFYHEKGKPWSIGTNNEGVILFDAEAEKVQEHKVKGNLSEKQVKTIIRDQQGNWWLGHPHSITHIIKNTQEVEYVHDANFMSSYGYAGSCIAPNGTLYFAGNGGITVLHPQDRKKQKKSKDIPVYLDLVEVNGEPRLVSQLGPEPEWKHHQNTLTFWFTALDLDEGATLSYSYQLLGHSKDWVNIGNTHRETFSNLRPGHYVLKVRVRMPNGQWSKQVLSYPFCILPPWWATWWAWFIYLLLAAALLYTALQLYTQWQMQKERLRLAQERIQYMMRHTTSTNLEKKIEVLPTEEEPGNPEPVLTERDRKFMEELYQMLDSHLQDNEFNVQQLAKEMLVSYSFLYNKVKTLTGETPQRFLSTYRMNRAMELLKSKKYTVSEVSFMVGASSLANFSKGFKKQFGISPTEAMK